MRFAFVRLNALKIPQHVIPLWLFCRYFYKQGTVQSPYWRQQLMWTHPVDGEPMVHHYSFARATQENLKRKVFSSGHFDDGNTKWDHLRLSGE